MNKHQQELESNILADFLDSFYKKIQPHSKIISTIIVVVFVGGVGLALLNSESDADRSAATFRLMRGEENLDTVYAGTEIAAWSQIFAADKNLGEALEQVFLDQAQADNLIKEAVEGYELAASNTTSKLLITRAHYGTALANEALGKTKEAEESYQAIIDLDSSDSMVKVAEERLARLKDGSTQEFLTWFAKQDFRPEPPNTTPGLGGVDFPEDGSLDIGKKMPLFNSGGSSTPGDGNFTLPKIDENPGAEDKAGADDKADAEAGADEADDADKEGANPIAQPPMPEKPATDQTPAEASTSESTPAEATEPAPEKTTEEAPAEATEEAAAGDAGTGNDSE